MTVVPQGNGGGVPAPAGGSGNLYDVLELVLDRGLVIDAFARVSLVGIELVKIDARVVVASVDTYLRFAEACNRLDLEAGRKAPAQLSDIVEDASKSGSRGKTKGALAGAVEAVTESLGKGRDEDTDHERKPRRERQAEHVDGSSDGDSGRRSSRHREE
ncbi:gas vesicle protein GvpJ [Streptomyces sp. NPDC018693]|uniref:gas vesicle protein GvpJ n=1 Tax=unclassified Streptomyces TaxID=2593676 RepID=UPI0037BE14AD